MFNAFVNCFLFSVISDRECEWNMSFAVAVEQRAIVVR